MQKISVCQEAEVISVEKQSAKKGKPVGVNTVHLLKVASQSFGMSAHETMRIAENLYLRGYTTYPRTESTNFSSNFNFNEIINQHLDHSEWGDLVRDLKK